MLRPLSYGASVLLPRSLRLRAVDQLVIPAALNTKRVGSKLCYLTGGTNVDHFCASHFTARGELVATNLLVNSFGGANE